MESLKLYAIPLLKAVTAQLIGVLGIFFVFGFVLSKIQKATARVYMQSIGWKGILWTAWIGTPIHELGHAFFAKLFRHKIVSMSLFRPHADTGNLGHVDHSYNERSLYQKMGNFFIGAAPMIWGSCVLVALLYFLVPNGREIFAPLRQEYTGIASLFVNIKNTLVFLFNPEHLHEWKFWIFLYLSFCVSSHLAPSAMDQKGMWKGFFWIVLIVCLVNAFALLIKVDITQYVLSINQYLGIFTAIFTYALIISLVHLVLASLFLLPFRKRM